MTIAFLFPGQGSQAVGMLAEACDHWPLVRQTFSEASQGLGYNLEKICREGPEEELNDTRVTQPALLTASIALWRQWMQAGGPMPDYLAGHSLGEYSALVAAEALSFLDAVKLVRLRGELMQTAVPAGKGRMAAVLGLADEAVAEACDGAAAEGVVELANLNAPGQVVIAGETAAVDRAIELCREAGAKRALPLPVSVPSHCSLMRGAADELAAELEKIRWGDARIPVVQNVSAGPETESAVLRANLVAQLYSPVRWTESVTWLAESGVDRAVECGPGKVLAGLVKRIDRQVRCVSIASVEDFESALKEMAK